MGTQAIYNKGTYGQCIYNDASGSVPDPHNYYGGKPVGCKIRGQIGKQFIYRVRQGNGYAGSKVGKDYQDKYRYFVPGNITNYQGEPSRQCFAAAVLAWQALPGSEKQQYNSAASRRGGLTGFNLFIQNYFKEHYAT